uniref:Uncharacterized protein n=1 Tax=Desertifilum tharense IPPAS B-1220 TaxID=1781255 RepID=A0ACD5GWB8_9CYAN
MAEVTSNSRDPVVAYRGSHRWLPSYEPVRLTATTPQRLRHQGVYLITGGLGVLGSPWRNISPVPSKRG